MSKGMTIVSEVIMAIGMITLAIVFSLISTEIISIQQVGILSSTQNQMGQDIVNNLEKISKYEGNTMISYRPPVDLYTIEESNGNLRIDITGQTTKSYQFQSKELSMNKKIENKNQICLIKNGTKLEIKEESCNNYKSIEKSSLCENGCNPNICQPKFGEDCTNEACQYPKNANGEAINECKPDYDPDYIDKGDSTTDLGWVDEDYDGAQSKGGKCSYDFECGTSGGKKLECNSATGSGPSGSYCCPSSKKWDGESCVENERIKLVFVPLNEKNGDYSYEKAVKEQSDFFKKVYPISEEEIEIVKMSNICNVPVNPSTCGISQRKTTTLNVQKCAINAGHGDADHFIGTFQNDICKLSSEKNIAGWSYPNTPAVIAESSSKVITAHEIGHNYGLNDEYVDACRYDIGSVSGKEANCLKESLDGDTGYASESSKQNPSEGMVDESPFCAGGSQKPNSYSIYCAGNRNSGGGRSIMSFSGAPKPRRFSKPSLDYLKTLGDFS